MLFFLWVILDARVKQTSEKPILYQKLSFITQFDPKSPQGNKYDKWAEQVTKVQQWSYNDVISYLVSWLVARVKSISAVDYWERVIPQPRRFATRNCVRKHTLFSRAWTCRGRGGTARLPDVAKRRKRIVSPDDGMCNASPKRRRWSAAIRVYSLPGNETLRIVSLVTFSLSCVVWITRPISANDGSSSSRVISSRRYVNGDLVNIRFLSW